MKNSSLLPPLIAMLILAVASAGWADDSKGIVYCGSGPFADCTEAQDCQLDESGKVAVCSCPAAVGDSVSAGSCEPATKTTLQSRYPGVPAFGVCTSGSNTWADCLGVSCTASDDVGQVQCACTVATSEPLASQQYVIVGVEYSSAGTACADGVYYSSATPGQVFSATTVLRTGRSGLTDPTISWVYSP